MIADSPYETRGFLLAPWEAILAGFSGALLMLGIAYAVEPRSGATAGVWLRGFTPENGLASGLAVHLVLGALLGILYAVCQQRISRWALIGVGIFYGVLLWVAGRILGWLFHTSVEPAVHSITWLVACSIYGLWLAVCAIWMSSRRRPAESAVPRD